ncbi:hypothetical protein QQP08_016970 [Theobroma cacao]|nr:hypothetical protein QQP08_016970 [Theobroma cacao]
MKDDIRHPYQSNTKASTNSNNGEIEVRDLSPVMGRVSVNCRKLVEYAFLLITMYLCKIVLSKLVQEYKGETQRRQTERA